MVCFRTAKEKKIKSGFFTGNLDAEVLKKLAPYLEDGNFSLTISLDGAQAETHDYIRGKPGAFDRTIGTLEQLAALKKAHPRMYIEIISIIMNHNLEELADIIALVRKFSVNAIQFQPLLENNLILNARHQDTPFWVPE